MRIFLFLCGFILLLSSGLKSQDLEYIWPTDSGNYLSSTFGETRSEHFHAGLDIKTWGREGYRVFASKDGVVSKLLITNRGYGKAIYLKHHDGTFTVYAHLQRFEKRLQAIADSVRLQDYSYTMEIDLEKDSLKVEQGNLIGFTGSTGIGPPHLHFEIRNQHNEPVNPLSKNLTILDTKAPEIASILFEPLEISARIDGKVYPKVIYPDSTISDTAYFGEISKTGKVGIAVNTFDQANEVNNRYAVYKLTLKKDAETLFKQRLDHFNFEQDDLMFIDRKTTPGSTRRKFQILNYNYRADHPFIVSNAQEPFSTGNYSLEVEDYFGNLSVALFSVIEKTNIKREQTGTNISYKLWTNDWVSLNDSTNIDLTNYKEGILWDSSSNYYLNKFPESIQQGIFRVNNNKPTKIISPDQTLKISIPTNTFFNDLSIQYDYNETDSSFLLHMGAPELIIRKEVNLQIYLGDQASENTYLFSKEDDQFKYVDSYTRGRTLNASITEFGDFVTLQDSISPSISAPKKAYLGNGTQTYSIETNDNLTGVDFISAVFKINGQRGIPEYDYESDKFTFYLPDFQLPDGTIEIEFSVKDRAGNLTKEKFRLKN